MHVSSSSLVSALTVVVCMRVHVSSSSHVSALAVVVCMRVHVSNSSHVSALAVVACMRVHVSSFVVLFKGLLCDRLRCSFCASLSCKPVLY